MPGGLILRNITMRKTGNNLVKNTLYCHENLVAKILVESVLTIAAKDGLVDCSFEGGSFPFDFY